MGGAAIATLAGDHIYRSRAVADRSAGDGRDLARCQRYGLRYLSRRACGVRDGNWWAAVFPLGMYSSATFATAVETGWHGLTAISLVFMWIALAAWLVTSCDFGVIIYAERRSARRNRVRISAITRSGYSVRSSHVKRSTCQPANAMAFWRLAVLVEVFAVAVESEAVDLDCDLLLRKANVDPCTRRRGSSLSNR